LGSAVFIMASAAVASSHVSRVSMGEGDPGADGQTVTVAVAFVCDPEDTVTNIPVTLRYWL
jgi:hypothetical protein